MTKTGRKRNWLEQDFARLELPAGVIGAAVASYAIKFAGDDWTQTALLGYLVSCWAMTDGIRTSSRHLSEERGVARGTAIARQSVAALAYAGALAAWWAPAPKSGILIFLALSLLPIAFLALKAVRPWLPAIRLPLLFGAGRLKLVKNTVRPGGIAAATLEIPEPYRELTANIELCDGSKPGEDYVFRTWPGSVTALEQRGSTWIARVEASVPDDAPPSAESDDESDVERFWELQASGVRADGAVVKITAPFKVR